MMKRRFLSFLRQSAIFVTVACTKDHRWPQSRMDIVHGGAAIAAPRGTLGTQAQECQ